MVNAKFFEIFDEDALTVVKCDIDIYIYIYLTLDLAMPVLVVLKEEEGFLDSELGIGAEMEAKKG